MGRKNLITVDGLANIECFNSDFILCTLAILGQCYHYFTIKFVLKIGTFTCSHCSDIVNSKVVKKTSLSLMSVFNKQTTSGYELNFHCIIFQLNYPTVPCFAGSYYDDRTATCKVCPPGTYQMLRNQTFCDFCPNGTTSTMNNNHTGPTYCLGRCIVIISPSSVV